MWNPSTRVFRAIRRPPLALAAAAAAPPYPRRGFHEYFITHIPTTSMHPDARTAAGNHHKLPREKSTPHEPRSANNAPASMVEIGRAHV